VCEPCAAPNLPTATTEPVRALEAHETYHP
jgi:hypothetical protein